MKKIELNYFEITGVTKFITGLDPLTGEPFLKGLINEDVTQGVKLRLNRILKKIQDPFQDFEKQRSELLKKYKGESETLEGEALAGFSKEFMELAKEKVELEIETIPFDKVEELNSSVDYSGLLEIICE